MNEPKQYALHIDGKLFRAQRELLVKIADLVRRKQPYEPSPSDGGLLEGLLNMTDAIADQAHDQHGNGVRAGLQTRCEVDRVGSPDHWVGNDLDRVPHKYH